MFSGKEPRLMLSFPRKGNAFPFTLTDWISNVFGGSSARKGNTVTRSNTARSSHARHGLHKSTPGRKVSPVERRSDFMIVILTDLTQLVTPKPRNHQFIFLSLDSH